MGKTDGLLFEEALTDMRKGMKAWRASEPGHVYFIRDGELHAQVITKECTVDVVPGRDLTATDWVRRRKGEAVNKPSGASGNGAPNRSAADTIRRLGELCFGDRWIAPAAI